MKAAFWTIIVLLALLFVFSGVMKLVARAEVAGQFALWGYPSWFATVIGVLELIAGIALFVPRAGRPATWLLIVLMLGAALTHVRAGEFANLIVNGLVVVGCIFTLRHRSEFAESGGPSTGSP